MTYYVEQTDGLLELRQDRFRDQRQTRSGKGHPHDVCAVARTVEEMEGMAETLGGAVNWGDIRKVDAPLTSRTPFEQLVHGLEAERLTLKAQWEVKREQGRMVLYQVRGEGRTDTTADEILVFHWDHEHAGYQSYIPIRGNSIVADLQAIVG